MIKEMPILFQDHLVNAIWEDRKDQTRRLNGLKVINEDPGAWIGPIYPHKGQDQRVWKFRPFDPEKDLVPVRCPYGQPGDRLWVRQSFRYGGWTDTHVVINFLADDSVRNLKAPSEAIEKLSSDMVRWVASLQSQKKAFDPSRPRPSIHMPKWAALLWLEVVDIRCERLQAITEDEARREGVMARTGFDGPLYKAAFLALWDKINGKKAPVSMNPWVWAVTFKRISI